MSQLRAQKAFPTTHWSIVLAAGRHSTSESRNALEKLCQAYWYPLYAYVRRQGYPVDQAQDLTQGFLARFLQKKYLDDVHRERGRFRSFLLASLQHFLLNERDRERAKKRGGAAPLLPLEFKSAENRYSLEPVDQLTPEKIFERQWALTLLEQATTELRRQFERAGKSHQFQVLSAFLTGDEPPSYAEIAVALGIAEGAARVAVHRLRRRYGQVLRAAVSDICATDEIDDEIRFLRKALSA